MMRSNVMLISIIIAFLFISGQSPAAPASVGSDNLLKILKEYVALIAALLAILSTVIGFIYQQRKFRQELKEFEHQQRKFRQELKEFEQKYISESERILVWVGKANQQTDIATTQASSRSPYILGTPIIHRRNFYGRNKEVEDILNVVAAGLQLHSISILGAPLSGKTSLLNYISNPHTLEEYNFINIIPVYLNLQAGINNPTDFYIYLLNEAAKAIEKYGITADPIPYFSGVIEYRVVIKFFQKACQKFRFLLIIDVFETFIKMDFDWDFFDGLRSLSTIQDIGWITSSYRRLGQIFDDKFGPQQISPFHNIFIKVITLGSLSKENARELVKKPAIKNKRSFSPDEIEFIIDLDRLMPFELQVASYALYKAKTDNPDDSDICRFNARKEYENIMQKFYKNYWDNLRPDEQLIFKSIVNGDKVEKTKSVTDLISYGYISKEKDSCHIAGAVFKEWIQKNCCD